MPRGCNILDGGRQATFAQWIQLTIPHVAWQAACNLMLVSCADHTLLFGLGVVLDKWFKRADVVPSEHMAQLINALTTQDHRA